MTTKRYMIDLSTLYGISGTPDVTVEPGKHIAYDIVQERKDIVGNVQWSYSVEGMEGRYITSYPWGLVDTDPVNLQRFETYDNARRELQLATSRVKTLHSLVVDVSTQS